MMLTQNITITANSPQSVEREFTERTEEKTALSANRIDVWKADLDHTSAALMFPYLSDDEWTRAQRFHQEIHRNRFIAGRALVRMAVSRYLGCKPAEIDFNYNLWGKPCLTNGDLQFNVAHSEEHFVLAVSREAVGVDIERIRTIEDIHLVARTVFSPEELTAWTLLPEPEQVAAFYKIWTRKEALLKALG